MLMYFMKCFLQFSKDACKTAIVLNKRKYWKHVLLHSFIIKVSKLYVFYVEKVQILQKKNEIMRNSADMSLSRSEWSIQLSSKSIFLAPLR